MSDSVDQPDDGAEAHAGPGAKSKAWWQSAADTVTAYADRYGDYAMGSEVRQNALLRLQKRLIREPERVWGAGDLTRFLRGGIRDERAEYERQQRILEQQSEKAAEELSLKIAADSLPDAQVMQDDARRAAFLLSERLSPMTRDVFRLVKLEGLTCEEVAERLGRKVRAVQMQLQCALALLAPAMAEYAVTGRIMKVEQPDGRRKKRQRTGRPRKNGEGL